jgi:hypothetical protein
VFFTSFDCTEPPHVHVERESKTCKFWLEPVSLARNHGFSARNSTSSGDWFQAAGPQIWRFGVSTAASSDPRIQEVRVTRDQIVARLLDGRVISVPLAWSWRLSEASSAQRSNFRIIGTGQGIHWPDVDEDISVEGMLQGTPAPRPRARPEPVVRETRRHAGAPNKGIQPPARKARRG